MHEICTDNQILGMIEQARNLAFVRVDSFWVVDRRMLDECNYGGDIRRCLVDGYARKLAALQEESRDKEGYGRPGDAARAQESIQK